MSEKECRNGHLMRMRDVYCKECGEPAIYVDGKSRMEWKWEARQDWWDQMKERSGDAMMDKIADGKD